MTPFDEMRFSVCGATYVLPPHPICAPKNTALRLGWRWVYSVWRSDRQPGWETAVEHVRKETRKLPEGLSITYSLRRLEEPDSGVHPDSKSRYLMDVYLEGKSVTADAIRDAVLAAQGARRDISMCFFHHDNALQSPEYQYDLADVSDEHRPDVSQGIAREKLVKYADNNRHYASAAFTHNRLRFAEGYGTVTTNSPPPISGLERYIAAIERGRRTMYRKPVSRIGDTALIVYDRPFYRWLSLATPPYLIATIIGAWWLPATSTGVSIASLFQIFGVIALVLPVLRGEVALRSIVRLGRVIVSLGILTIIAFGDVYATRSDCAIFIPARLGDAYLLSTGISVTIGSIQDMLSSSATASCAHWPLPFVAHLQMLLSVTGVLATIATLFRLAVSQNNQPM